MGNAPRQPNFDPHSKTYNPGWRHHPNFGWGGQGNQFQQGNQFNQGHRQYNNNFQQSNHSFVQPNTSKQPSELELALQKLTLSTTAFIDGTNNFMNETKATLKNQEAAIQNLEVQVGQIAKQLSEKPRNTLPSDTIPNPIEECKAISLRSGKVVGEETTQSDKEVPNEDKKKKEAPAPSLPIPTVKPYEPRIPYPQRLQGQSKEKQ
ncbi:hypothetical protein PIB30_025774 [Stylosanthes scabra]|uniref:Uncharacterized protein n=1 Tax=Stylosanthes scabra TaxID=79078 RepID=A0ABU6SA89_9FABA|nr:hypothetical protein [Stylosanthes scabra]